jgi:hypothetical protein
MLKSFAHYLLKKRSNAAWVALAFSVPAFLSTFSMVIVGLVTLRKGAKEGLYVLIWATLPFIAHAYVAKSMAFFITALSSFVFFWLFAWLLKRYGSWSLVLQVAAILSVVIVAGAHVVYGDVTQIWRSYISEAIQHSPMLENVEISSATVHKLASIATGVELLFAMVAIMLKLVVARWWQASVFNPGGLRKELLQIRLNKLVLLLFVLLMVLALVYKTLAPIDVLLPLLGAYMLAGLSILHFWLGSYKHALLALVGFYIAVAMVPAVLLVVVLLAVVDSVVNLRVKMA